jgi:hypothetical protein
MANAIHRIIGDLFTGPDGKTHDPARWLWIIGVIAFLGFSGFQIYKSGAFDMVNFGVAFGTLLGSGAAGVKIKESTEPKGTDTPPTPPDPDPK